VKVEITVDVEELIMLDENCALDDKSAIVVVDDRL